MKKIPVSTIVLDDELQPRAELDQDAIDDYALAFEEADNRWPESMPPIHVFQDEGGVLWLADGWHRVHAAKKRGVETVVAMIHKGDRRAALIYSTGVNDEHGLRRTNEDKRRAVTTLLKDEQWSKKSVREIASQCKVSRPLVESVKAELDKEGSGSCYAEKPIPTKKSDSKPAETGEKPDHKWPETEEPEPADDGATDDPDPEAAADVIRMGALAFEAPLDLVNSLGRKLAGAKDGIGDVERSVDALLKDPLAVQVSNKATLAHIKNIRLAIGTARDEQRRLLVGLKDSKPTAACHNCRGAGCDACNNTGWLSKMRVDASPKK